MGMNAPKPWQRRGAGSVEMNAPDTFIELALGVLSHTKNTELRHAIRETWMTEVPPSTKVVFLLNREEQGVVAEQAEHGDIVVLNSSYSGRGVGFREKIYTWLKIGLQMFPRAKLIGKVDDDIFLCPQQMAKRKILPT